MPHSRKRGAHRCFCDAAEFTICSGEAIQRPAGHRQRQSDKYEKPLTAFRRNALLGALRCRLWPISPAHWSPVSPAHWLPAPLPVPIPLPSFSTLLCSGHSLLPHALLFLPSI